jgi:hypothetical protein
MHIGSLLALYHFDCVQEMFSIFCPSLDDSSVAFITSLISPLMQLQIIDRLMCNTCSTSEIAREDTIYLEEDVSLHKIAKCLIKLVPFQPSLEQWALLLTLWCLLFENYQRVHVIGDQQHLSILLDREDRAMYADYLKEVTTICTKFASLIEKENLDRPTWHALLDRLKRSSQFQRDVLFLLSSL